MKPTDKSTELPLQPETALAVVEPSVGQMLATFIDKGITSENVDAFAKLIELRERMDARDAERQFAAAFVRVQEDMPAIEAVRPIPDKYGNIKYYYAPLEEIMPKVKPVLLKHGFTMSFNSEIKEDRVILTCTLAHRGGHTKQNISMAKIGSGPPGASGAQADGAASTYAKRRALCDALSIVAEIDTDGADARNEGAPISFEQAAYLKEQVKETGANEAAFLSYAGAKTYEEIGSARYDSLVRELAKKARK